MRNIDEHPFRIKTEIIKINCKKPEIEIIRKASKIILNGGLVAFPTDTLYGLGANFFDKISVKKVYKVKNRPPHKPLIALIGNKEELPTLASTIPKIGRELIEKYWPGPLTIIFKAEKHIPRELLAGGDTIAVRMPNSKISLALLRATGVPLTSPSANISNEYTPMTAKEVYEQLNGRIELILDGGVSEQKEPSTLVDVSVDPPVILRQGVIQIPELT